MTRVTFISSIHSTAQLCPLFHEHSQHVGALIQQEFFKLSQKTKSTHVQADEHNDCVTKVGARVHVHILIVNSVHFK